MTSAALTAGRVVRRCVPLTASPGLGRRLAAFAPLCLFALLSWSGLLAASPAGSAWAMTFFAVAAGCLLAGSGPERSVLARRLLIAAALAVLLTGALLSAGVAPQLLGPRRWDELTAGIAGALGVVPSISSPYRGDDSWVRATVLLGGGLFAAVGAVLAFWPAPGRKTGSPVPAAMALTTAYGIAVIEVPPQRPFLSGAIYAVLLAAFLFADRIRPAQVLAASGCVALATLVAATAAPVIDSRAPWLDLQQISEDVANTGTVGYKWDHDYAPLDWPREGRELLRITAQAPAYWKAQALDAFDGRVWRGSTDLAPIEPDGETDPGHPEWIQQIGVKLAGLRTRQFVTAGQALDVKAGQRRALRVAGGTFVPERGILRRGTAYSASVYTPDPNAGELGRAGTVYPSNARLWLDVQIPDAAGQPRKGPRADRPAVRFAPFASGQADLVTTGSPGLAGHDARAAMKGSGLKRTYDLARRLRSGADEPYDYALAVQRRVRRGATYTEKPRSAANPLDTFLFESRRGYCQHFSGAMAVLLRMGGVPARVAVGFSPGTLDRRSGEYVVRDYDAHSWVEAYFPRIGWVTFDPTPAAAPPRDQSEDRELALGVRRNAGDSRGDRQAEAGRGEGATTSSRASLPFLAVLTITLLLAGAGGLMALRRVRRSSVDGPPELAELERALNLCGRPSAGGVTLFDLERLLGGTEGARGYLRAVSAQRFAASARPPSREQRRALRVELSHGLGRLGWIRAWLAIPPSPRRRSRR